MRSLARALGALAWYGTGIALAAPDDFTLTGPGLTQGGRMPEAQIFDGFGCHGGNRSPALSWTAPPAGTRSLAITLHDTEALAGRGWWHWTVINLQPDLRSLPAGVGNADSAALPQGAVQGRSDFGRSGFGGACPPAGDPAHHYVFTVWALDVDRLPGDAGSADADLVPLLGQHAIRQATLTVHYDR